MCEILPIFGIVRYIAAVWPNCAGLYQHTLPESLLAVTFEMSWCILKIRETNCNSLSSQYKLQGSKSLQPSHELWGKEYRMLRGRSVKKKINTKKVHYKDHRWQLSENVAVTLNCQKSKWSPTSTSLRGQQAQPIKYRNKFDIYTSSLASTNLNDW